VLHAAGLPGGGIIQLKDHAAAERIMAPKIAGLRNLIAALGDQKPACVVLFSSINAVIGVSGQVDYTAANIYLDAFAHAFSREHGIPCVSVNWDTWKEAGMAVNTAVPANLAHIREQQLAAGIASAEGLDVFDRVLASGLTQVVVSTRDLHARICTHTPSMDRATEADIPSTEDTRAHDRPDLGTAYVPARSDVDKVLIHIWGKLLGQKEIGIHDDFFELGGHSLLATQVVSRLRDTFKMDVPIRMLFEASTIAKLSDDLVARESKPGRVAKIARLFLMVENMSPEEVARALQTKAVSA
jgi:acyl carrier protein